MNKNNYLFGRIIKINKKIVTIIVKKIFINKKYKIKNHYYTKLHAYDIYYESKIGDFVMIKKSRPITKLVFWIICKIIEKIKII